MNIRPVRLAPCAAGASPTISTRARGSPNPGTGRPQYSSSRNEARFVARDLLAPRDQARAGAARDDLRVQASQGIARAWPLACLVVRVLLIVNTTASSVTARKRVVIQKALGADHDLEMMETSRRGHAARLARGAGPAGRRGRRGARRRRHAERGGRRARRHRDRAGAAARRLDERLRPHARHRPRPGRRHRRSCSARSSAGRSSGSGWARSTAATSCSTAASASTPRSSRGSSATRRSSATPRTRSSSSRRSTPGCAPTTTRTAASTSTLDSGEVIEGGTLTIVSKTSPYTYLGNRPLVVAPAAGLDTPLSVTVVKARHAPSMLSLAAAAMLSPEVLHRHPNVEHRDDVTSATITGHRAVPVPGRRRLPRRGQPAGLRLRAGRPHARRALTGTVAHRRSLAAERLPRDPGRVGDDRRRPRPPASRTISAGSLTVQTLSAMPSSAARAHDVRGERLARAPRGAGAAPDGRGRARSRARRAGAGRRRRGTRSGPRDRARGPGRSSGGGTTRRAPSRRGRGPGSARRPPRRTGPRGRSRRRGASSSPRR